jgi:hypothetical protein
MLVAQGSKAVSATKTLPPIKKPANLDLRKGERVVQKVLRENKEWLKEMADK